MAIVRKGDRSRVYVTFQPVERLDGKTVRGKSFGITLTELSLEEGVKALEEAEAKKKRRTAA